MKKSHLRISLTAATLILTMLACVLPGLSPASAPAPTADTVSLATMVAETVAAALEETASAVTPVPTSTPVPFPPYRDSHTGAAIIWQYAHSAG